MRALARRQRLGGVLAALVVIVGSAVACGDASTSTEVPVPVATLLTENPGIEAQTGTVGAVLAAPISIKLTRSSQPVGGAVVSWTVRSGGGAIDAATSTTDANGDAVVHWTLGTVAGADTLVATTSDPSASDAATSIITATAVPDAPAQLSEVSGDAQAVATGAASAPIVVKVVDRFGNVVPGATVTWSVSGGAAIDNAATPTDTKGLAQVVLTSASAPGTYTVTATVAGVAPVSFTEVED